MSVCIGKFAFTNSDGEQVWEALCSECGGSLGTMTLVTMLRAVIARGDLRCPDCRGRTCSLCDTTFDVASDKLGVYGGWKVCWYCMQEVESGSLVLFPKSQTGVVTDEG